MGRVAGCIGILVDKIRLVIHYKEQARLPSIFVDGVPCLSLGQMN
jgi:hypothetical protein